MFPVVPVNPALAETLEPLGTKRKYWYRDGDRRLLFKAEERGTGEDWAEKIACELAGRLGLPHVVYELATEIDGGKPGVVCESCAPKPSSLVMGNQLLLALDSAYPAADAGKYKVKAHTVEAVAQAVSLLKPPPPSWMGDVPAGIVSALDVFTGYVLLDAWVANQDRHHENWGLLVVPPALHLAPTFDHGAALARNLTDDERHERMTSKDRNRRIPAFARRARSAFYGDPAANKSMTTVQAWQGFAARAPGAAAIWLARLGEIDDAMIQMMLTEIPPNRMSHVCREFTLGLLRENRERLLSGEKE
jgi:hypothetical protein